MADNMEVIISAIDQASEIFSEIASSCSDMMSSITSSSDEASDSIDDLAPAAEEVETAISEIDSTGFEDVSTAAEEAADSIEGIDGSGLSEAASGADDLGDSLEGAANGADDLSNSMGVIEGSMLLSAADQIGSLASGAEDMAQQMNTAAISVGQLAKNTGVAEPQMVSLINTITNATFPQEEAMAYVQALQQMGVSADQLGDAATNMDKINDATGMGYTNVMQLTQGLRSVGIEADNLPASFNAISYAQANVNGGAQTLSQVFKRQAATINEYGLSVDQTVLIMQKLSEQGVQGMKMGSALSDVLKENNGDIKAIEQSLGMTSGTLENAADVTGKYEGQLQSLADEEGQHKTILDQLGTAWDKLSLSMSGVLSPFASVIGFIGQVGSFGMTIKGLKELGTTIKEVKTFMNELNIIQTIHNAIEGEGAIASIAAALGITTEAAAAEGATVIFGGLAVAEGAVLWPLLAIVAAAALVAAAIYEIGKAFGWWTDVGTMIDAIWAGLQRLWNAFINHPDVQAVIGALTDAWNALVSAIGWAWNALLEFFGVATGGEFDIVRALIEAIGTAWEAITFPIRLVISIIQELISVFSQVGSGQMDIYTAILTVWNMIIANLGPIFQRIINAVVGFAGQLAGNAITAAVNFVNNIINNIRALPGRFLQVLQRVALYILLQANLWVLRAVNGAKRMFQGIINNIMNLPGRVYAYMLQIATRITSGASSWFSKATTAAGNIVRGVTGAIADLPGKVYNKVLDIGTQLTKVGSELYNKAKKVGENIWKGITSALTGGAYGFDYEGMFEDLINSLKKGQTPDSEILTQLGITSEDLNITTDREYAVDENLEVNVNQNMELILDLKNVPHDMDENTLLEALQKMVQDKSFIELLVNNSYFQSLDSKVKARLLAKANRARGV